MNPYRRGLPEEAWRRILLVQVVEELDAEGRYLLPAVRQSAGQGAAGMVDDGRFLKQRAERLAMALPAELAQPEMGVAWYQRHKWLPWGLVVVAFLLGWWTNELGPERMINVLALPLVGLVLWNLLVVFLALAGELRDLRAGETGFAGEDAARVGSFAERVRTVWRQRVKQWEKPVHLARIQMWLHAAALALTLGVLGGMYARALVKEYGVTWESTFLEKPQVMKVTQVLLGPASMFTGIPVPALQKSGGAAAPWIHLWAMTAFLLVMVPRAILWHMAWRRWRRGPRSRDRWVAAMAARARAQASGTTTVVDVWPLHGELGAGMAGALAPAVGRHWGVETSLRLLPVVPYGQEATVAVPIACTHLVVVFSLATTPETTIHGAFFRKLATQCGSAVRCLVVLDSASYEQRFAALPEYGKMVGERRRAWEVLVGGVPILLVKG